MIKKIWDAIQRNEVRGEIQMDASVLTEACGDLSDCIDIHCWDGRRYALNLVRLPDGCAYDLRTGKPLDENGKPQIKTQRDALVAMIEAITAALNDSSCTDILDEPIDEVGLKNVMETIEWFKNPE